MPSHYNKKTTGENHAHTKPSKEDTTWQKMKEVMKGKPQKKRNKALQDAMKAAGM